MRTHNVGQRQACGKSGAVAAASRCGAAGTRVRMCSVHPCRAPLTYRFNTGVGSAVRGEWSNSTRGVCLPQRRAAQMLRRETGVTDGRRQIPLNFWNAGCHGHADVIAQLHTHTDHPATYHVGGGSRARRCVLLGCLPLAGVTVWGVTAVAAAARAARLPAVCPLAEQGKRRGWRRRRWG